MLVDIDQIDSGIYDVVIFNASREVVDGGYSLSWEQVEELINKWRIALLVT